MQIKFKKKPQTKTPVIQEFFIWKTVFLSVTN